jgi:NADPH:quinone reductase
LRPRRGPRRHNGRKTWASITSSTIQDRSRRRSRRQVAALGLGAPSFVFATVPAGDKFADLAELIAPQGRLALINGESADVPVFMRKSVAVCYELMFTRPLFRTADMEAQHGLLNEVAALVETGRVRSTMRESYGRIDAANLMRAMEFLKSGRSIGKIVLAGF